jgi:hypothetical protein
MSKPTPLFWNTGGNLAGGLFKCHKDARFAEIPCAAEAASLNVRLKAARPLRAAT